MLCKVDVRTMKRMMKSRKQRCRAAMSNSPVCRASSSRVTPSVTPLRYTNTQTSELSEHKHTINLHDPLLPVHDIMVLESVESSEVELTETQESQSRIRHHKRQAEQGVWASTAFGYTAKHTHTSDSIHISYGHSARLSTLRFTWSGGRAAAPAGW